MAQITEASMWQKPFVDVFRRFGVIHGRNSTRSGPVDRFQDDELHKMVFRIDGASVANTYLTIDPDNGKRQGSGLGLNGRFIYFQIRPVPIRPLTIHLMCLAEGGRTVRVSISNLFRTVKKSPLHVQLPFTHCLNASERVAMPETTWCTAVLDLHSVFAHALQMRFLCIKTIDLKACMHVAGVFTSDNYYTPESSPRAMWLYQPPADGPDHVEEFVWIFKKPPKSVLLERSRKGDPRISHRALAKRFATQQRLRNKAKLSKPKASMYGLTGAKENLVRELRTGEAPAPLLSSDWVSGISILPQYINNNLCVYCAGGAVISHCLSAGTQKVVHAHTGWIDALVVLPDLSTGVVNPDSPRVFLTIQNEPKILVRAFQITREGDMQFFSVPRTRIGTHLKHIRLARADPFTTRVLLVGTSKTHKELLELIETAPLHRPRLSSEALRSVEVTHRAVITHELADIAFLSARRGHTRFIGCCYDSLLRFRATHDGRIAHHSILNSATVAELGRHLMCVSAVPPTRAAYTGLEAAEDALEVEMTLAETIMVGLEDGHVLIMDTNPKKLHYLLRLHEKSVASVHVSRDCCITSGLDGFIRVWPLDFTHYMLEHKLDGPVVGCRVSDDNWHALTLTDKGSIDELDVNTRSAKPLLRSHLAPVAQLVFGDAASYLHAPTAISVAPMQKTVRVWDLDTNLILNDFQGSDIPLCCARRGAYVAIGFQSGAVALIDTISEEIVFNKTVALAQTRSVPQPIVAIAFVPPMREETDDKLSKTDIVFTNDFGELFRLDANGQWEVSVATELLAGSRAARSTDLAIHPNLSNVLFVVHNNPSILRLIDATTLETTAEIVLPHQHDAEFQLLQPLGDDSKARILVGCHRGLIASVNPVNLDVSILADLQCETTAIAVAHHGAVAFGNKHGVLHLQINGETQVFHGHAAPIQTLAWSPDGRTLLSGGSKGIVTRWEFCGDVSPQLPPTPAKGDLPAAGELPSVFVERVPYLSCAEDDIPTPQRSDLLSILQRDPSETSEVGDDPNLTADSVVQVDSTPHLRARFQSALEAALDGDAPRNDPKIKPEVGLEEESSLITLPIHSIVKYDLRTTTKLFPALRIDSGHRKLLSQYSYRPLAHSGIQDCGVNFVFAYGRTVVVLDQRLQPDAVMTLEGQIACIRTNPTNGLIAVSLMHEDSRRSSLVFLSVTGMRMVTQDLSCPHAQDIVWYSDDAVLLLDCEGESQCLRYVTPRGQKAVTTLESGAMHRILKTTAGMVAIGHDTAFRLWVTDDIRIESEMLYSIAIALSGRNGIILDQMENGTKVLLTSERELLVWSPAGSQFNVDLTPYLPSKMEFAPTSESMVVLHNCNQVLIGMGAVLLCLSIEAIIEGNTDPVVVQSLISFDRYPGQVFVQSLAINQTRNQILLEISNGLLCSIPFDESGLSGELLITTQLSLPPVQLEGRVLDCALARSSSPASTATIIAFSNSIYVYSQFMQLRGRLSWSGEHKTLKLATFDAGSSTLLSTISETNTLRLYQWLDNGSSLDFVKLLRLPISEQPVCMQFVSDDIILVGFGLGSVCVISIGKEAVLARFNIGHSHAHSIDRFMVLNDKLPNRLFFATYSNASSLLQMHYVTIYDDSADVQTIGDVALHSRTISHMLKQPDQAGTVNSRVKLSPFEEGVILVHNPQFPLLIFLKLNFETNSLEFQKVFTFPHLTDFSDIQIRDFFFVYLNGTKFVGILDSTGVVSLLNYETSELPPNMLPFAVSGVPSDRPDDVTFCLDDNLAVLDDLNQVTLFRLFIPTM